MLDKPIPVNRPMKVPNINGLLIPQEILTFKGISPLEKLIFAWIYALQSEDHSKSTVGNRFLSENLEVTENTIISSITKLVELGLAERNFGRHRILKAYLPSQIYKNKA